MVIPHRIYEKRAVLIFFFSGSNENVPPRIGCASFDDADISTNPKENVTSTTTKTAFKK
ncbi:MAG: hypothetical protein AB8E82_14530 [Aureispira sp.]